MSDAIARLRRATFFTSAHALKDLPPEGGLEVAFAGRSNAGKSSALNTLAGQNRLAHVSKTPGRTQLINYFAVEENRFLVDLPGYGYAKVPEAVRKHWQQVLPDYLATRHSLAGLVLLMDCRTPFTELDRSLIDWVAGRGVPLLVLLTKADKLSRSAAAQVLADARKRLQEMPFATPQLFSSLKRQGLEEAARVVVGWLRLGEAD